MSHPQDLTTVGGFSQLQGLSVQHQDTEPRLRMCGYLRHLSTVMFHLSPQTNRPQNSRAEIINCVITSGAVLGFLGLPISFIIIKEPIIVRIK